MTGGDAQGSFTPGTSEPGDEAARAVGSREGATRDDASEDDASRDDGASREDDAARRDPRAAVLVALDVPRQARRGFGVGTAFAVALFVFFVLVPGSVRSPAWYAALAFVVAFTSGALATLAFVLVEAYRIAARPATADDR